VQYQGIYPGVDLVYYGNEGQLEYDFIVAPGADPKVISLAVDSTSYKQGSSRRLAPRLDANGDLVLGKEGREIRFHHPVVYQEFEGEKRVRDGRYEVRGNGLISFVVGSYDTKKPLIIDPVLTFSTFLGGASFDRVLGVAVDSSRNIYVTGETNSADFPTAGGVSPNSLASSGTTCGADTCPDVFVTKLDPTGTNLIYSTYIGGDGVDGGEGIAVDGSGNAHITGHTTSSDFPHSGNAYQQSPFLGQSCVDPVSQQAIQCDDAIVVKLNPAGNLLLYSSYFGSVGEETGHAIAINSAGMIFITGYVGSNTFPKTSSAYQTAPGGGTCGVAPSTYNCGDAFVAKFNPALSGTASLIYSTYLGGNGDDYGYGIAVDSSGNAYVTGLTLKNPSQAENFPTKGAYQPTFGGVQDAFVTELNSAGTALVYSTYLGGSQSDDAYGIALDSLGRVYVTGSTLSGNFPTKTGAFQTTQAASGTTCGSRPCYDVYVTKLDTSKAGTLSLVYSTYLGGTNDDISRAIAVDSSGNAYVTGGTKTAETDATPFPLASPLQDHLAGGFDVFVAKIIPDSTLTKPAQLPFSTYLGGANFDAGFGIAVDSSGAAIVAGRTDSSDFPFTLGVVQEAHGGAPTNADSFVAKISPPAAPAVSLSSTREDFGSIGVGFTTAPQTVDLRNEGSAALDIASITITGTYKDDFLVKSNTCGSSVAAAGECAISLTFTPLATGGRDAQLTITDNASGSPHQIPLTGNGTPAPVVSLSPTSLDFGFHLVTTPSTPSAPLKVTVSNTGSATLNFTSILPLTSGDFSQTNTCTAPLAAGGVDTCEIDITFAPSVKGLRPGSFQLTDNAGNSPQTISVRGIGATSGFNFFPPSLAFGDQLVGTTSAKTVALYNGGPTDLSLSVAITLGGSDFAKVNNCSSTLIVDATCYVDVTFKPTTTGLRTGTLRLTSTSTVSLTGTGTIVGISLSPSALSFGNQTVGTTSAAKNIVVTSTGTASLLITNVSFTGDFAKSADTCTGSTVAPTATCTIGIKFTPTATGSRTGTVTLTHNAQSGSPNSVALSGTGTQDFAVSLKTNSPAVTAGQTASYTITFTPAGGFNQNISLTCTGAPKAAVCSVSPNPATMNGTKPTDATVSVTTTARSMAAPILGPGRMPANFGVWPPLTWLAVLLLLLMTANLLCGRRKVVLGLAAMLLIIGLWTACGGGGGGGGPPPTQNGTPAGTYKLTVTATSGGLTHALPLTLKVN
jgi:hypothetical protein